MAPVTTAKEAIVSELWPVLGGNHLDAEKWSEISKAVEAGLIATHPVGVTVADDPRVADLLSASDRLGWWMSAALDDDNVCNEIKADIQDWMTALAAFAPDREGK